MCLLASIAYIWFNALGTWFVPSNHVVAGRPDVRVALLGEAGRFTVRTAVLGAKQTGGRWRNLTVDREPFVAPACRMGG
jgi:hypothetical protein